jgi:hypothetical protein
LLGGLAKAELGVWSPAIQSVSGQEIAGGSQLSLCIDLPFDCSSSHNLSIVEFCLQALGEWASEQPEILAVPLVGSQAKGIARLDSGMNLVLIVSDPTGFFAGAERMKHFGHVRAFRDEDWGPLRSRRIHYASGLPARSQSTPNHFRGSVIPREPS